MHKKGQAITEKEKEQVIALAQTQLALKEIADKIGISPRSVGRILKENGISRGSKKSPKVDQIISIRRIPTPETLLDPLQVARKREHSDYLRKQLQYLAAHIRVPPPEGIFLWPMQTESSYPINELYTSGPDDINIRQSIYVSLKMIEGKIQVSSDIERTEDWKFLQAHLAVEKAPAIIEDYTQWVISFSRFFTMCSTVLATVVKKTNKRINKMLQESQGGQRMKIVTNWGDRGIHRWFYEDIYYLTLGQHAWDKEEFDTKIIEEQPDFISLWRNGKGLSVGTMAEVDVYKNVHQTMVDKATAWTQTKNLLETYKQCQAKGKALLFNLNILEKRGDFKGTCEICRPWYTSI